MSWLLRREGAGYGRRTAGSKNVTPNIIRNKLRRQLLHQMRRSSLTTPIRKPSPRTPIKAANTTRRDHLTLLVHIPLLIPCI